MSIDPRMLGGWVKPRPIADDRLCVHCGYNIKGLNAGGRCPECGELLSASTRRTVGRSSLSAVPIPTLSLMGWGATITGLLAIPVAVLLRAFNFLPASGLGTAGLFIVGGAMTLVLFCWAAGVWLLTVPSPVSDDAGRIEGPRGWTLREGARWSQLAYPAAAAVATFEMAAPGGGAVRPIAVLLGMIAGAGLSLLALHVHELNQEGNDGDVDEHLRWCVWLLGPLAAVFPLVNALQTLVPIASMLSFWMLLTMVPLVWLLSKELFGTGSMLGWAVRNAEDLIDREERLADEAARAAARERRRLTQARRGVAQGAAPSRGAATAGAPSVPAVGSPGTSPDGSIPLAEPDPHGPKIVLPKGPAGGVSREAPPAPGSGNTTGERDGGGAHGR
jgi:hypothetical protein